MIVTVYTKDNCQPCKATLRKILGHKPGEAATQHRPGMSLVIVSAEDHDALLRAKGMLQAPVVRVEHGDGNETWWSGFAPHLVDRHLPPLVPWGPE